MYYGSPSNFANVFRAFYFILDIHEESVHQGASHFLRLQGIKSILKATVFGVFEDVKFKILEGSDQN